jgi:hyaluronan synthase
MGKQAVMGRNRPARGLAAVVSLMFTALFVTYVVWSMHSWWGVRGNWFLTIFFGLFATVTTCYMLSGLFWRSWGKGLTWEGRVVAMVPFYDEAEEKVHEVIDALINQSFMVSKIYVMDDGSTNLVRPYEHPRVVWMRQENAGKRHAQAAMLAMFEKDDYDLILTVDSDSVFDLDAVEHMVKPFARENVHAATAMIYTANWNHNLMTRFTDINLQVACLQMRMLRSWMGIVSPTSGAIAMYRPWVLFDNLDDYLNSGAIGDDRRLSFYALQKGKVITVNEAACETHLPETPRGIFKQRTRWAKSAWLGLPYVLKHMKPFFIFWYTYPLLFVLLFPISVVLLSTVWIVFGVPTLIYGVIFWHVTIFCMAGVGYCQRPTMRFRDKVVQMMLTLLYPWWGLALLRMSGYKALLTLKDQGWGTRGVGAPEPAVVITGEPEPALATVTTIDSRRVA